MGDKRRDEAVGDGEVDSTKMAEAGGANIERGEETAAASDEECIAAVDDDAILEMEAAEDEAETEAGAADPWRFCFINSKWLGESLCC